MIKENLAPDNVNSIDDLFEYLYGIRPTKSGASAELLYYIISKIDNLNPNIEYHWNQKIKLYNNEGVPILSELIFSDEYKNHNHKILNYKGITEIQICRENIFLVNYKRTIEDKDLSSNNCKWEKIYNENYEQTIINEPIEINYNNKIFKASGMKFIREIIKENRKISKGKCFLHYVMKIINY